MWTECTTVYDNIRLHFEEGEVRGRIQTLICLMVVLEQKALFIVTCVPRNISILLSDSGISTVAFMLGDSQLEYSRQHLFL